jgi:hypothetical protein
MVENAQYIRVGVAERNNFSRFRVKTLENGIKSVIGFTKDGCSEIQSILLPREKHDLKSAILWVSSHGYKINETLLVHDIIINPKTFDLTFIEETVTETQEAKIERPKSKPWAWLLEEDVNLTGFDI